MREAPGRWRTIEHTADLAIEVESRSLEALFEACALGMTGVLFGNEQGEAVSRPEDAVAHQELALEAPDRGALLVEWLRELLYVHVSQGLILVAVEIRALDDTGLVARAGFGGPDDEPAVERELKGVTYHDLEVGRRSDRWFARVVFDL